MVPRVVLAVYAVLFLFFATAGPARALHEEGTVISVAPEATLPVSGTRVTLRVRVRDASGQMVRRAEDVAVTVTRTAQPIEGSTESNPKYQELPLAPLSVLSVTPDELRAAIELPSGPEAVVTVLATLDAGTEHEIKTTTTIRKNSTFSTLRFPGLRATPSQEPVGVKVPVVASVPLPVPLVAERVGRTVGVGATAVAATTTLAGLLSLIPDLGFMLQHAGLFLSSMFSVRRKRAGWGTVIDSATGRPVARAVVLLLDAAALKVRASVIAGSNGVFAFAPPPGVYHVQARAPGYRFPAQRSPPAPVNPRMVVYQGEPLTVTEETLRSPPQLLIPLDRSMELSRIARASLRAVRAFQRIALRVAPLAFLAGIAWNTLFVLWYPSWLAWTLEIVYILLFLVHLRTTMRRRLSYGQTLERSSKEAIPLVSVRVYDNASNRLIQTVVSDASGRFFLFLPTGVYTVIAEKEEFEPAEDTVVVGKRVGAGVLGGDIFLRRVPASPAPVPPAGAF